MFRTILVMSILLGALASCSDDSNQKDSSVAGDSRIDGAAVTGDKGPAVDGQVTADKSPTVDAPAAQKVEAYVPADNEATGWVENTAVGKAGVEAGYTTKEIDDIIDGSHDPYAAAGCNGFAKQDYKKGDYKLVLFLWDMTTNAAAKKMFDDDKKHDETMSGLTFEAITDAAESAIIANDVPEWKVYGYKSHYIYKIRADFGDASKADAAKPDVVAFVKVLAGKLP